LSAQLSLSSFLATGSCSDCLSLTQTLTQRSLQTAGQSGNLSSSYSGGSSGNNYNSQSTANYTVVSNTTVGLTLTQSASMTASFFEAGVYNQGSFSLSSVVQQQTDTATQSSISINNSSLTLNGTYTGSFVLGAQVAFSGQGNFLNTQQNTDTLQDSRTLRPR
jgi:hypothetical protein